MREVKRTRIYGWLLSGHRARTKNLDCTTQTNTQFNLHSSDAVVDRSDDGGVYFQQYISGRCAYDLSSNEKLNKKICYVSIYLLY